MRSTWDATFFEGSIIMRHVDLNSDLGESFGAYIIGNDQEMLKIITSANVACGFHGGDPLVMHETLKLANEIGVGIGAHPSYIDQWGFGRRVIHGERPDDIEKILIYQIGAIQGMAQSLGLTVTTSRRMARCQTPLP